VIDRYAPGRSLKTNWPISAAKTTLVSRKAETGPNGP